MIDKLPFPPPSDPLVEARVKRLEAQGRSPFNDYFVAEAAVALKQGAGRLIRSETDRGLLVVCDPRLAQMGYGRRLLAALPPMRAAGDRGGGDGLARRRWRPCGASAAAALTRLTRTSTTARLVAPAARRSGTRCRDSSSPARGGVVAQLRHAQRVVASAP